MTNCLLAVTSLRGFASSHASPITLLVCIIVIPAVVSFAVLSYVLKLAEEDEDEVTYNEDSRYTMMSTREWFAQRYVPCALEADIAKSIPLEKFTHAPVHGSSATVPPASSICVVCLAFFQESEELKVLPPCQHAFHPYCIDPWFETHSTCPICRCTVTVPPSNARGNEEPLQRLPDSHKLVDVPSISIVID